MATVTLWRGQGHVLRFEVEKAFLDQFEVHEAGGRENREYWIPAERLDAFNDAIAGLIQIVASFP